MNVGKMVGMAVAALLLVAGAAQAGITIETVPVGNPGNAADTRYETPGYGSVAYTYNIGKYEVTAGEYTAFLTAVGRVDAYALYNTDMSRTDYGSGITRNGGGTVGDPYTYSVAADFASRPVNYVSWGDAARFANWLHNGQKPGAQDLSTTEDGAYCLNGATSDAQLLAVSREADWKWAITSEDEWYKAAYYNPATGTYFDYPTSSNTAPGRDMADASGNNGNHYGNPYPIDNGKYTTLVGEFQNSDSPYGTFDQGGNVWEWDEAILYGSYRGHRGGSFDDYGNGGGFYLRASSRNDCDPPTYESAYLGFRVTEVPEPATMAVLAFGSIGMLLKRRGLKR